jgi:hypothetical protein
MSHITYTLGVFTHYKLQVALIGEKVDLTYDYTHLGTSAGDIKTAAKSAFVQAMKDGKKPMILVGPGVLQRTDAKAVLKSIYDLAATAGVVFCWFLAPGVPRSCRKHAGKFQGNATIP